MVMGNLLSRNLCVDGEGIPCNEDKIECKIEKEELAELEANEVSGEADAVRGEKEGDKEHQEASHLVGV